MQPLVIEPCTGVTFTFAGCDRTAIYKVIFPTRIKEFTLRLRGYCLTSQVGFAPYTTERTIYLNPGIPYVYNTQDNPISYEIIQDLVVKFNKENNLFECTCRRGKICKKCMKNVRDLLTF